MKRPVFVPAALVALALVLQACGGGDSAGDAGGGEEAAGAVVEMPPGSATISGTVRFTGAAPERPPLRLDPECRALNEGPVLSENVVVNENGTLRNAFVYVKEGLPSDTAYPVPGDAAVLDQQGCKYTPHVLGVMAGQDIRILNSDPLQHNINAQADANRGFNLSTPNQGDERERSFRVEEVPVRVKCDVHPWMGAYIAVVNHPFHAVTGDDGSFSIGNLPAGTYTVELWHEQYGTQTGSVTVEDGGAATLDFAVSAS